MKGQRLSDEQIALRAAPGGGRDAGGGRLSTAWCERGESAVDQAEQASTGYRAVSVIPKLSNGHAVAVAQLLKSSQMKSVSEPLE